MEINAIQTTPEERREATRLALPELPAAIGTSLPWQRVGVPIHTGLLGKDLTTLQWDKAASISAMNGFAQSRQAADGAAPTMFEAIGTVPVAILEPQHP